MSNGHAELDAAIAELDAARKRLKKKSSVQVSSAEEKDYLRSVAYSWLYSRRKSLLQECPGIVCADVDVSWQSVVSASHKSAARKTYDALLKKIRSDLINIRASVPLAGQVVKTSEALDSAPDFSPLAADQQMRTILVRRWDECQICIRSNAHLAATVMMGGLLEALFVARANALLDKSPLFKAKGTPCDSQTKKPKQLKEWVLSNYIDVGHELGWITKSAKDVASVLRESRNYVHPDKERRDNVTLSSHDTDLFWLLTRQLTVQLLASM